MSDDYLWDPSGTPDPEIQRLEADLRSLRHEVKPLAIPPDGLYRRIWPYPLAIAAAAALIGLSLFAPWEAPRAPEPPPSVAPTAIAWAVTPLAGAPRADGTRIEGRTSLAPGAWIETDADSRALVDVGSVGTVEVNANTRMRILAARSGEHRIAVARGSIKALIWAPPRVFFVETPAATAIDLGCSYTIDVDPLGVTLLRVLTGWVALELRGIETLVPAGARCVTTPDHGPSAPFFEDASPAFLAAAAQIAAESRPAPAIAELIREARPRDTLTLWHLLPDVDGAERAQLVARLEQEAALPRSVTREGIMRLDPAMMRLWQEALRDTWAPWRYWK